MIEYITKNSAFFKVEIENTKGVKVDGALTDALTKYVKSLTIKEEAHKYITGSIEFYDSNLCEIASILKLGTKLDITWGYKSWDVAVTRTKEYMSVSAPQRKIKAIVSQPSGGGSSNGEISYNCEFFQLLDGNNQKHKQYKYPMVKKNIVIAAMTDMGIRPDLQFISFDRENETVDWTGAVIQDYETPFKFLNRLSMEWRAIFRVGYTTKGDAVGLFVSPGRETAFQSGVMGAVGLYNEFRYKTDRPNVISYSWNYSAGLNGSGDNVRVVIINGKTEFIRTRAESGKIKYYKLNTDKMKSEMSAGDYKAKIGLFKEWMSEENFDKLVKKGYFTEVASSFAPQGIGFTIHLETIGNPFITSPNKAIFKGAFPDYFLESEKRNMYYYITSVTHSISSNGYKNSLSVVDSFTFTGGSLVS